jgi:hypothetical protein
VKEHSDDTADRHCRRRAEIDGLAPEYVASARHYLGQEAAAGMVAGLDQPGVRQARISVRPDWVGLIDFAARRPSVLGGVS